MPNKKVEFRTGVARISIDVANGKELKREIGDIKSVIQIIDRELKDVVPEPVLIRPELTDTFSSDGKYLSFSHKTKLKRNEQVILTVYGYGSKGATIDQIETTTGISNVKRNVIYSGHNKHYFRNVGRSRFALSADGDETVKNVILPSLT